MIYSCSGTLKQLAFIAARQLYPIEVDDEVPDKEDIVNILNNNHLNSHFQNLAREVSLNALVYVLKLLNYVLPHFSVMLRHCHLLSSRKSFLVRSLLAGPAY